MAFLHPQEYAKHESIQNGAKRLQRGRLSSALQRPVKSGLQGIPRSTYFTVLGRHQNGCRGRGLLKSCGVEKLEHTFFFYVFLYGSFAGFVRLGTWRRIHRPVRLQLTLGNSTTAKKESIGASKKASHSPAVLIFRPTAAEGRRRKDCRVGGLYMRSSAQLSLCSRLGPGASAA